MRKLRIALWILVALASAGLLFAIWGPKIQVTNPETMTVGGPFELTDSTGARFSSERLEGRPHALFFGFTHCPDVCPTTLARLTKLRRELGKGDDAFDIVLISVAPERDTPAELARYIQMFPGSVTALTGTPEKIAAVTKSFGIFAEKVPDQQGGYTVDHSAQVLLFNRDGSFGGTIAFDEQDAPALQKLRNMTAS
jgi:protein SCO1/2